LGDLTADCRSVR